MRKAFLVDSLFGWLISGEDALANLSVEKSDDGKITGHVRIRSKGQGMALSLGQVVVR
jgi:coatomer subunit beta